MQRCTRAKCETSYSLVPLCGTPVIFMARQMQENFRVKGKKLYFGFVDLEKAFDRVPREVISWAMRKLGVEEWLVSAVMSMYTGAKNGRQNSLW